MGNRREFIKKVAVISGASLYQGLFRSIEKAAAITPDAGTDFHNAEHIVILMQENRSFDHTLGTLQGVRGFGDPRAMTLPDGNPVWLQTNAENIGFIPFRLDINNTKATWMGSLPHSWMDQVDARNEGNHDRWLESKAIGNKEYAGIPFTLGFYDRSDLPFYYSLADAFTVCDQYFCSSLTGTTPNRIHHWAGTIRDPQVPNSPAKTLNEDVDYGKEVNWKAFPERLEEAGISWKIYQNELSLPSGLTAEQDDWLGNFTDNPLEWFSQYQVHFSLSYHECLKEEVKFLQNEVEGLRKQLANADSVAHKAALLKKINEDEGMQTFFSQELERWSPENFAKLPVYDRNLHAKAFCTNIEDPHYRELTTIPSSESPKGIQAPKGDIIFQFRNDVLNKKLPTVSWLVAPANFSDHPSSPWYGAWYISQILDTLTESPEVWKKTIFILNYDENDGLFDHIPPFVPPHPTRPNTGLVSPGIDVSAEYVEAQQEKGRRPENEIRESPIGLGYRVPAIIASPWTRGGCVCSEVFDHTSVLQFLETFLSKKISKQIRETNISQWRRTVCGDLTSAFQSDSNIQKVSIPFPTREEFLERIFKAQFQNLPKNYQAITQTEMKEIQNGTRTLVLPQQEKGVRRSAPLPYRLLVNGRAEKEERQFKVRLDARKGPDTSACAGAPFIVHAITAPGKLQIRNYAVKSGEYLEDTWLMSEFENQNYHLKVHGPNGFYREFRGSREVPLVNVWLDYHKSLDGASGKVELQIENTSTQNYTIKIADRSYGGLDLHRVFGAKEKETFVIETQSSFRWYDLSIHVLESDLFLQRYAGRVETGEWGFTDPAMGQ